MEFQKFPSLVNSYQEKAVNRALLLGIEEWVVTEKIHGANMGIYCDGESVRPASRNNLVDGSFFNCQSVIDKYADSIKEIYNLFDDADYIIVYGEYYGGLYGDTSSVHAKRVQKGVYYNPENDFAAFSVLLLKDGKRHWVCTHALNLIIEKKDLNLQTVPILFKGSLPECLNFNNHYQTTIPARHGLEPIENNIGEGNVILPYLGTDYESESGEFRGFKNKTPDFSERQREPKKKVEPLNITPELRQVLSDLQSYATDNRFNNVLSKEGEFEAKKIGKYIGLMLKDIYEDYLADGNTLEFSNADKKYLTHHLTQEVREVILKHM